MDKNKVDRSTFKNNFLKNIILRLDFQGVLQVEMENLLLKVKSYLKEQGFTRYEEKINNQINVQFQDVFSKNKEPEISSLRVYSFSDDNGYTVDLSHQFIIVQVNTVGYSRFEDYSDIFIHLAQIYKENIDFFSVKRFGLRKINFCFVKAKESIKKYFSERYFDTYDLFENSDLFASEKKENFSVDDAKMNLRCAIEQGKLDDSDVYQVTLDIDIYKEQQECIEQSLFVDKNIGAMNDKLFAVFVDSLTEEFIDLLINEKLEIHNEIIGVERNE